MAENSVSTSDRPAPKPENFWLNLICNIVLPGLIMSKLSAPERLGPVWALVVGVAIPLGYGIYDLIERRKWNLFSVIGVVSVLLTGGLGLMKASGMAFAVKEAAMPAMLAIAVLATVKSKRPLVREMMLNESIIDVPKLELALDERGTRRDFDQLLLTSTRLIALSLGLSAVLNFILARAILKSPPGSSAFTEELGHMTWLSWPVIFVPTSAMIVFAFWRLIRGVHQLTGHDLEALMRHPPKKKAA